MKNNKLFTSTVLFYFIIVGAFHFLRLALDWKVIIVSSQRDYSLSTLISAICFLFSVFMIYWLFNVKKNEKKIEVKNIEED